MSEAEWAVKRMCTNKRALTKEQADRVVDKHAKNNNVIYYYRCPLCQKYHMTGRVPGEFTVRIEIK